MNGQLQPYACTEYGMEQDADGDWVRRADAEARIAGPVDPIAALYGALARCPMSSMANEYILRAINALKQGLEVGIVGREAERRGISQSEMMEIMREEVAERRRIRDLTRLDSALGQRSE